MRNRTLKWIALLCAIAMMAALAACGGAGKGTESGTASQAAGTTAATTAAEAAKEPVVISIFARQVGGGIKLGEQEDPVAKEIEKKLGIRINVYKDGSDATLKQVLGTMLASNDLADIQFMEEDKNVVSAIKAGSIIPLDELLKLDAPNIMGSSDLKTRLEYNRKKFSPDGIAYTVGLWGGTGVDATPVGGPYIRWDLYKKLGYPAIGSEDDLVKVLTDMQALEPQTADGKKVYAAGGWFADGQGWGDWIFQHTFGWARGYAQSNYVTAVDISKNEVIPNPLSDPGSTYWKSVGFYYKIKQAGLLDPDSATQKYDKYSEKMKAGRYLLVAPGWEARALKTEFEKLGKKDVAYIALPSGPNDPGTSLAWTSFLTNHSYAISKTCKNPAAAMKLLDFVSSAEGARMMHSGVENLSWKMQDGKPVFTEEFLNDRKTLDAKVIQEKYGVGKYVFFSGYALNVISPKDGEYFDLAQAPSYLATTYNEAEKDAIAHFGAKSITDIYLKDKKPFMYMTEYTNFPDKTADMKTLEANLNNYVYANIFKCVFAKNDGDFEARKKAFIDGLAKYKADEIYQWYKGEYNKLKEQYGAQLEPLAKEFADSVLSR